jgi:hypothetical protein
MAREETVPTTALVGLQGQLDTVRSEIITTNTNLQSIGTLIRNDSVEDQRRLIGEREQEKNLLERKIRTGQEESLQQKVSSSLLPPVVKLENKLNSTFGKVGAALSGLFGFFGTKIIQGIQTSAQLGLGALKGIGNLLKGSFGFIANILGTLGRGFTSVLSGIGGITGKVVKALGSLAASPFKAIADLVGKLLPGLRGGAAAAAGVGAASAGSILLKLLGVGSRISTGTDAVKDLQEGNIAGASINAVATVFPSPLAAMGLTGLKLSGVDLNDVVSKTTSGFSGAMEGLKDFDIKNPFSGENLEALKNATTNFGINFNAPPRETEVPVQPGSTSSTSEKVSGNTASSSMSSTPAGTPAGTPAVTPTGTPGPIRIPGVPYDGNIQPQSRQKPNVSNISEPPPDVVYLRSDQKQQASTVSGNIPTLTDVPLIPSANPDNFYAVYAQLNYNVVL